MAEAPCHEGGFAPFVSHIPLHGGSSLPRRRICAIRVTYPVSWRNLPATKADLRHSCHIFPFMAGRGALGFARRVVVLAGVGVIQAVHPDSLGSGLGLRVHRCAGGVNVAISAPQIGAVLLLGSLRDAYLYMVLEGYLLIKCTEHPSKTSTWRTLWNPFTSVSCTWRRSARL